MEGLNAELMNGLTDFLLSEVGEKVLHGISYTLCQKKDSNKAKIDKYLKLRHDLSQAGIGENEIFKVNEVSNGYIFDLDLKEAIWLTQKISESVARNNNGDTPTGDFNIASLANERHREDLERLKNKVIRAARNGIGCVELALFSRNKTSSIVVTGKDAANNKVEISIKYDAFAIRHTDMTELNRDFLEQAGLRVTTAKVYEILPSETGVRFKLNIMRTGG